MSFASDNIFSPTEQLDQIWNTIKARLFSVGCIRYNLILNLSNDSR